MKRSFSFLLSGLVCLALIIDGCGKTGPAGAVGPAGATGATGAAGPQGPEGNADVFVDTFSLTSAQWHWNSQYSLETSPGSYTEYFTRYDTIKIPAITQGIIDSGLVMVSLVPNPLANTTQWASLPYQFLDGSENFFYFIGFQTYIGKVELDYFFQQIVPAATIPTLSTYNIPTYKFKVMVISGSLVALMKQQNVNTMNYEQVSHFLDLP